MTNVQDARGKQRIAPRPKDGFRILVASAGDPGSLGAIRVASALARHKHATVHVVTVATFLSHFAPSPLQAGPPILSNEENQRVALEATQRLLATVPGAEAWQVHAVTGRPTERIVDEAERWPASLLVIGLGEHGAMGRLLGSGTAVKIAQRSKVPLLAVPPDVSEVPVRAAAAIDFTASSMAAARLAATLLVPDGVVTLVHASMLVKEDSKNGTLPDVYTRGASEKLETLRTSIHRATKRRVSCVLLHGEIVDALVSYVEREHCDLLALGGHDQGFLDRILLGSVRASVLRTASSQVLVAPHE